MVREGNSCCKFRIIYETGRTRHRPCVRPLIVTAGKMTKSAALPALIPVLIVSCAPRITRPVLPAG
jgi:hypothetical protein